MGTVSVKARPLTTEIVCEHAAKLWLYGNEEDALFHAIFVLGLNLGSCFDEVRKLSTVCMSVTSDFITL